MLHRHAAASSVLPLILQIVVEVSDHVLDRLVPALRIESVLDRVRRFDEVVDVDSRTFAEDPPDEAGQIEEEGLNEKKDGNPLVVTDVLLHRTHLSWNDGFWKVVGVRHPTQLVRVLLVVASERGRAPAVYGAAYVLCRAYEHGEDHEERDGVAMVQSINEIVIVTRVDLGHSSNGREQTGDHDELSNVEQSESLTELTERFRTLPSASGVQNDRQIYPSI